MTYFALVNKSGKSTLISQGVALAQNALGINYAVGRGVGKNYTEAVKWFRKAAEQGHVSSQFFLAVCYENGNGVRQSYTKAKEYYGLACDNGNDDGCKGYARLNKQGY